ncbi:uncharacterized protein LOC119944754 isoform X1 [Tachyglossus aculeatus]|uniref:uncharacterized protein LOC119944754 isoform X1 n=1 Tax=Tachyglossus aculeatus TaxID=9261 RepID=UPI0018F503AE|nr:uncharacterized protein LOC119944754 isoform X1 [Tachyglossus aculeatus]XP_038621816.1 uncharacterized protein LOC119944754 isoform X1 [Tachyglossus aculeatus]
MGLKSWGAWGCMLTVSECLCVSLCVFVIELSSCALARPQLASIAHSTIKSSNRVTFHNLNTGLCSWNVPDSRQFLQGLCNPPPHYTKLGTSPAPIHGKLALCSPLSSLNSAPWIGPGASEWPRKEPEEPQVHPGRPCPLVQPCLPRTCWCRQDWTEWKPQHSPELDSSAPWTVED